MQQYQKGDIVNVDLGLPPIAIKGHEQAKERPCIIIQTINHSQLAIVLPVTGTKPPQPFYTIVYLPKRTGGLIKDSFVLCHQIRAISFNRIKGKRGHLELNDFLKIKAVLIDTLDL